MSAEPSDTAPSGLSIPKGDERCLRCGEPVGLHNGIKAIDCLVKLAQTVVPDVPPWEDPRVDVIVDHWLDEHPGESDPSWPTVASKAIRALKTAGWEVVRRG